MIHKLRIGTRGSPLALAQAEQVAQRLKTAHPALSAPDALAIVVIQTTGDRILDRTLAEAGGKGLFTKEIDEALLSGEIDLAVHSMKDVPTALPDGIDIACVLERADPRDGFLTRDGGGLSALPPGAKVGTASLRRKAQILHRRPDLVVVPLRGNVGTRLAKLADGVVAATLLAMAGLSRLSLTPPNLSPLPVEEMLPAVAQGAIAITCRTDDTATKDRLAALDHVASRMAVTAERAFLAQLDGSCKTPIAGYAMLEGDVLSLRGLALRPDGSDARDVALSGFAADAAALGTKAGRRLLDTLDPGYFEG